MSFLPSISPGNVKGKVPTDWKFDNDTTWTRPTEWIDLNIPSGVPEKIIGLVAVFPSDSHNYVSFNIDTNDGSSLTVNWGDGTTETIAEDTTVFHAYDYDSITSDTSTAKSTVFRGYKQVKFEITLTGSAAFDAINFDVAGPFVTHASSLYRRGSNILDLFVSSANSTYMDISDNYPFSICEQIEIRNTSSNRLTTPSLLYQSAKSLQSIPFVPFITTSNVTFRQAFYGCHVLRRLPDDFADPDKYWFTNPTSYQETFRYCFKLEYLPNGLFGTTEWSSCGSFYLMFAECRALKYIPYLPMRTGSGTDTRCDYMFYNCTFLKAIPQGFSVERADTNGIDRTFYNVSKCTDWSALYDGGVAMLDNLNIAQGSTFSMSYAFGQWDNLLEFPYIGSFSKHKGDAYAMFLGSNKMVRFNSQYTHIDLSGATGLRQAFQDLYCMEELPEIRVRSLTASNAFYYTFYNMYALRSLKMTGMISHTGNGEYYRCFYNCRTLAVIDGVDFSFATEASDYYQIFHVCRDISAIRFPGTFRAGYASPRINVTVNGHADVSGEYQINANGEGYAQVGGNGILSVVSQAINEAGDLEYQWTFIDNSDGSPSHNSDYEADTQNTPHLATWPANTLTFTEVETGFKYSLGNDGLRYCPIQREDMLEIFNQLVTQTSGTQTLDLRDNSYTADLTAADKLIAENKGWNLSL